MNKFIFLFTILSILLSVNTELLSQKFYEQLVKTAPFKVKRPEESRFADWTEEEIKAFFGSVVPKKPEKEEVETEEDKLKSEQILKALPSSYDFRKEYPKCMLDIRDQKSCGSCWAFSTVTAFQERNCLEGGTNRLMSPQHLVSCDKRDNACNGGNIRRAWEFINITGVVEEECFPYSSARGGTPEECREICTTGNEIWNPHFAREVKEIYKTSAASAEADLKLAIYEHGPIATHMVVFQDFDLYDGGIYEYTSGSSRGGHAIVMLGWGEENGKKYWICQNSWGPRWGEKGFFRIKMGDVNTEIGTYSAFGIANSAGRMKVWILLSAILLALIL